MTDKKQAQTSKDSMELNEVALDEISGGPAYIKFEGIDGESLKSSLSPAIKAGQVFKF